MTNHFTNSLDTSTKSPTPQNMGKVMSKQHAALPQNGSAVRSLYDAAERARLMRFAAASTAARTHS